MGEHFAVGFDNACLVIPISVAISVSVFPRVEVSPRAMLTETQPSRASRIRLMCESIMRRMRKKTSARSLYALGATSAGSPMAAA